MFGGDKQARQQAERAEKRAEKVRNELLELRGEVAILRNIVGFMLEERSDDAKKEHARLIKRLASDCVNAWVGWYNIKVTPGRSFYRYEHALYGHCDVPWNADALTHWKMISAWLTRHDPKMPDKSIGL